MRMRNCNRNAMLVFLCQQHGEGNYMIKNEDKFFCQAKIQFLSSL